MMIIIDNDNNTKHTQKKDKFASRRPNGLGEEWGWSVSRV